MTSRSANRPSSISWVVLFQFVSFYNEAPFPPYFPLCCVQRPLQSCGRPRSLRVERVLHMRRIYSVYAQYISVCQLQHWCCAIGVYRSSCSSSCIICILRIRTSCVASSPMRPSLQVMWEGHALVRLLVILLRWNHQYTPHTVSWPAASQTSTHLHHMRHL